MLGRSYPYTLQISILPGDLASKLIQPVHQLYSLIIHLSDICPITENTTALAHYLVPSCAFMYIYVPWSPCTYLYVPWCTVLPVNIQTLSNIRSRVESRYDIRCLIREKVCNCLALVNIRKSVRCMLVFWIMIQTTDEKRDCLKT